MKPAAHCCRLGHALRNIAPDRHVAVRAEAKTVVSGVADGLQRGGETLPQEFLAQGIGEQNLKVIRFLFKSHRDQLQTSLGKHSTIGTAGLHLDHGQSGSSRDPSACTSTDKSSRPPAARERGAGQL